MSSKKKWNLIKGNQMLSQLIGPPKPEWHIVSIFEGFVVEVNCNGGGYRRVYRDDRIEVVDASE